MLHLRIWSSLLWLTCRDDFLQGLSWQTLVIAAIASSRPSHTAQAYSIARIRIQTMDVVHSVIVYPRLPGIGGRFSLEILKDHLSDVWRRSPANLDQARADRCDGYGRRGWRLWSGDKFTLTYSHLWQQKNRLTNNKTQHLEHSTKEEGSSLQGNHGDGKIEIEINSNNTKNCFTQTS